MQRLAQALAPDDQDHESDGTLAEEVSGIGLPKQSLNIDAPVAYRAAPFPEPGILTPEPESEPSVPENSGEEPSAGQVVWEESIEPIVRVDSVATEVSIDKVGQVEPVTPSAPTPVGDMNEGPVLRAARALAEVRLRAEENGFLKRRTEESEFAESKGTAIPPVFDTRTDEPGGGVEGQDQGQADNTKSLSFKIPQGPLRVRLDAFASWAMELAEASRIVIVDGQGYPLLHRDLAEGASENDPAMVDSAMRLTSVLEQVQVRTDFARDGALNLPLEEGGWLGVLRCENAGGRLCIAVVTPNPLAIEASAAMKNELARTMGAVS